MTHSEVEAGADIVVMHGAPLLHGVEIYRGRPIFYDLGNFIYNVPPILTYIDEPMAWESVVAEVEFHDRRLLAVKFRPIVLNNIGEGQPDVHNELTNNEFLDTRGLPSPAVDARAAISCSASPHCRSLSALSSRSAQIWRASSCLAGRAASQARLRPSVVDQDPMKVSRSALMMSACVVGMPWGNP